MDREWKRYKMKLRVNNGKTGKKYLVEITTQRHSYCMNSSNVVAFSLMSSTLGVWFPCITRIPFS